MLAMLLLFVFTQTPEVPVEPLNVNLDTVTIIHDEETPVSNPRAAAWSPVSDTLAFVDDGIYLVWPKAGWIPSKMKNDTPSELKWSPDGKKLAYMVNEHSRDEIPMAVVIDVPSGRTLLVIDATGRWDLRWRNSNDICLRDREGGKWRRFRVARDSVVVEAEPSAWMTASGRLLIPPLRVGDPFGVDVKSFYVPGLDSSRIGSVFTYDVCKDGNMVLANAIIDSARTRILLYGNGAMIDIGSSFRPDEFSPDCRYVIGTESEDDGHQLLASDLWILEVPSLRKARLTDSPALESEPTFSYNRTYLAYRMEKDGASFLVVCTIAIEGQD
jgi:hypothetical protein